MKQVFKTWLQQEDILNLILKIDAKTIFVAKRNKNQTTIEVYVVNKHGAMPLCSGLNKIALGAEGTIAVLEALLKTIK